MVEQAIVRNIGDRLDDKIIDDVPLSGGCISDARKLTFASGKIAVLKSGAQNADMFSKEANGLAELAKADALRIPRVLLAEKQFLLIEYIEQGHRPNDFFEDFGRKFADLHRFAADAFGFYENNYIGATLQENLPSGEESQNWTAFYLNKRLLFQLQLAEQRGFSTPEMRRGFQNLESRLAEILSGGEEPPALLHGDLWSGNFLVDSDGSPCLIDPAVYYGHREADLAMTKLFGGFGAAFYEAYQERYPLTPGYEYREDVYKLYHVMNHLNLFGGGYYSQAVAILKKYF